MTKVGDALKDTREEITMDDLRIKVAEALGVEPSRIAIAYDAANPDQWSHGWNGEAPQPSASQAATPNPKLAELRKKYRLTA